ncbi:MAG: fimbrial protein, partial [Tannerellaceae bacterium]|nr:fimbrial protein [Tannerellaceae bacterium]
LDDIGRPEGGGGKSSLTVLLNSSQQGTRSSDGSDAGTAAERKINEVEFYVFDADGTRDNFNGYIHFTEAAGEYTFPVTEGSNKTVLVAVNMQLGNLNGAELGEVKKALYNTSIPNPLQVPAGGVPMAGEYTNLTVSSEELAFINVVVDRLYARFNAPLIPAGGVTVTLSDDDQEELTGWLGGTIAGEIKFTLNGYYVINGLNQSFAFPNYGVSEQLARWNPAVWTIGNNTANYISSLYDEQGHIIRAYSGSSLLVNNESVYLYENSPLQLEGSSKGYNSGTIYAMIVQGTLYDSGNPENKINRYWRIDVTRTTETANIYKILRNAIYRVSIHEIRTLGYGTPKEAEEEKPNVVDPPQPPGPIDPPEPPGPIDPPIDPDGDAEIIVTVEVSGWKIFDEGTNLQ